jgi:hypothetical protein
MPQAELSGMEKTLKELIGKNVVITYVGPDLETSKAMGKLKNATAEQIEVAGIMNDTILLRKNIKLIEIQYVQTAEVDTVKLFIRKIPGLRITGSLLRKIGLLIEQGKTCAKNNPRGVEWELANWDVIPIEDEEKDRA